MNRFSMLSTAPKGSRKVPSPGTPSAIPTGVQKPRIAPKAASTRMYGKADPAPGADMFGGPDDRPYRR